MKRYVFTNSPPPQPPHTHINVSFVWDRKKNLKSRYLRLTSFDNQYLLLITNNSLCKYWETIYVRYETTSICPLLTYSSFLWTIFIYNGQNTWNVWLQARYNKRIVNGYDQICIDYKFECRPCVLSFRQSHLRIYNVTKVNDYATRVFINHQLYKTITNLFKD